MAQRGRRPRRVVADLRYRLFNITVLAVGALVTLAGTYDPQRVPGSDRAPGWTILAVLGVLMIRSARLGLVVEQDDVVIRSWFTTRRVPRRRIVDVTTTAYCGGWNRNGSSGTFKMLRLELVRGAHRDVQAVAGRPHRLRDLRHTTRTLLELPGSTPAVVAAGRRRAGARELADAGPASGRRLAPVLGVERGSRVPPARAPRRRAAVVGREDRPRTPVAG